MVAEMDTKMAEIDKKMGSVDPMDFPEYHKALQSNAGDSAVDYLKWKSDQVEATAAARKSPTMIDIVTTLQKTDFSDNSSIGKLFDALFADGAPDVPIASSSGLKLSLRPSLDVLDTSPPDQKPIEALSDEKPADFDKSKYTAPTFNPYLISLRPSMPENPKISTPVHPTIAFQLGTLIFTTASSPKSDDWLDSKYIVLLNPDLSLWIAFNYTPYDSMGQRAPVPVPTKMNPKSCFPGFPDEAPFDVAMLQSSTDVKRWDTTKLGSSDDVVKTVSKTRAMCGLVARPAEQVDLAAAGLKDLKVGPSASGSGRA